MTSDDRKEAREEMLEKLGEALRYFVVLALMITVSYFIGLLRDKVNELDGRISKIERTKEQQP